MRRVTGIELKLILEPRSKLEPNTGTEGPTCVWGCSEQQKLLRMFLPKLFVGVGEHGFASFQRGWGHSGTTETVVLCGGTALTPLPPLPHLQLCPSLNKKGSNQYLHAHSGFCLLQVPMIPSASTSTRHLQWVPSNRRRFRTLFLFSAQWPRS